MAKKKEEKITAKKISQEKPKKGNLILAFTATASKSNTIYINIDGQKKDGSKGLQSYLL